MLNPFLLYLVAANTSFATQIEVDLCTTATKAVVATVQSRDSSYVEQTVGNHTIAAIYTDVVLSVDRVIHGPPISTLSLRVEGGEVGNLGARVSGSPKMPIGGTYFLAIYEDQSLTYPQLLNYAWIPPEQTIPSEQELKDEWEARCGQ